MIEANMTYLWQMPTGIDARIFSASNPVTDRKSVV